MTKLYLILVASFMIFGFITTYLDSVIESKHKEAKDTLYLEILSSIAFAISISSFLAVPLVFAGDFLFN